MASARDILALLTDDEVIQLHEQFKEYVLAGGVRRMGRRLASSGAGSTSAAYEFDFGQADFASALRSELLARGLAHGRARRRNNHGRIQLVGDSPFEKHPIQEDNQ